MSDTIQERLRDRSTYGDALAEEAADEIDRLSKRIEELDRHRATLEYMDATGEWVTHDQIDAAWKMGMEEYRLFGTRHILGVLEKLGIVACEKCGGTKRVLDPSDDRIAIHCDCPNNGWKIEVSDE